MDLRAKYEQAIQTAAARPLLCHKRNRRCALRSAVLHTFEQLQKRCATKTVACGWPGFPTLSNWEPLPLQRDGIEEVNTRGAHFVSGSGADVHVHFVGVIHLQRIHARGLKMNAEPGEDSGDSLSGTGHDPNGLRKMQRVKYGIGSGLRQPLDAQKTVGSDLADDVSRFVYGGHQQTMR